MNQETSKTEAEEKMIEHVAQIAAREAIVMFEQQKVEASKKETNKRLHNAKLLLRNYKAFKKFIENLDEKTKAEAALPAEILSTDKDSIIDLIEFSTDIVGSIKENTRKTIVMVRHVENALKTLEHTYKIEDNERYYSILRDRYIEGLKPSVIAEKHHVNNRTVYKALDHAAERFAILLFGVYGIKFKLE